MRSILRSLAVLTVALGLVACGEVRPEAPATASPQPSACATPWGAMPTNHLVSTYTTATIASLRAGEDACFDRLAVDLGPPRPGLPGAQGIGYQLKYVPEVRSSGSGEQVPIEGGAVLVVVLNAAAHDEDYQATYEPRDPRHAVDVTGFATFRQVAFLGTFEAQTEIAIGVREELPFRAFVLSGPDGNSALVIDVAHRS